MESPAAAAKASGHGNVHTTGTTDFADKGAHNQFITEKQSDGSYSRSDSGDYERKLEHADTSTTGLERTETGNRELTHTETTQTTFDQPFVYRNGEVVKAPAASTDPKDPLNLSKTRKVIAVFFVCFFGSLAASAELILGAMLPVFALEYAGVNPKELLPITQAQGGFPAGADPLKTLENIPGAAPIFEVYLLGSLPVLIIGLSNLALIPLAISVGRRPVIIGCGIIAIAGAIWAGCSQSLRSHIGARCIQAFGAGTVESLIPFIIQDMVFYHERNTWISGVFGAQGIIIIALGIASPYIIIYLSWRWVYFITASSASLFLIGVFFFLPETRWERSRAEMNGVPRIETGVTHTQRTWKHDWAMFHGKKEWKKGWDAFIDTLRTFFYPQIFFITMLNSAMIACTFAAGYTVSPALLTKPWAWPFLHLGLCLIPLLIAGTCAGLVTGVLADWSANYVARKRGKREPENQLLNLVFPTICALIGTIIFALAGENQEEYSYFVFLLGLGLMAFGFLGANTVGAVYVLECYPHLAGPALVNIASFRCLIAFVLVFKVSDWVADLGYFDSFIIYTGIIGFFALLIPVVYIYGGAWRKRWPANNFGDR